MLDEAEQRGGPREILDSFIAPMIRRLRFDAPDQAHALAEAAKHASGYTAGQREKAQRAVLMNRQHTVGEAHIRQALASACVMVGPEPGCSAMLQLDEDRLPGGILYQAQHPDAFDEWVNHAMLHGQRALVDLWKRNRCIATHTLHPPNRSRSAPIGGAA